MVEFIDDDSGYRNWIRMNPTGYVLTRHREAYPSYLLLHRADCHTINPDKAPKIKNWTAQWVKNCSINKAELQQWADDKFGKQGHKLRACGHCIKSGKLPG